MQAAKRSRRLGREPAEPCDKLRKIRLFIFPEPYLRSDPRTKSGFRQALIAAVCDRLDFLDGRHRQYKAAERQFLDEHDEPDCNGHHRYIPYRKQGKRPYAFGQIALQHIDDERMD